MSPLARTALVCSLAASACGTAQAEAVPKPLISVPAPAQPELMAIDPDTGVEQQIYSSSHALLIGESVYPAYTNDNIDRIPDEFEKLSEALQAQGFSVDGYVNLKGAEIRSVVSDFIHRHGYQRDARIVLLFAGHGQTRSDPMETDARSTEPLPPRMLGYLLPVDAPKTDNSDWPAKAIRFSEILEWADAIEAKHVLTLLDTCFSGAIFEGTRSLPDTKKIDPAWVVFRKPVQFRSRLFVTAGTTDQRVPKTSSIVQTFKSALRGELRAELADYNRDGFLTGEELYSVMYREATRETGTTPQRGWSRTPGMGRGDIVFKLPSEDRPQQGSQVFGIKAPDVSVLSKRINGPCPEHCEESKAVEERLELSVAPGVTAALPSLTCSSEDGGLTKWVQKPTWDRESAKVVAVVRVWAGSSRCLLTYRREAPLGVSGTVEDSAIARPSAVQEHTQSVRPDSAISWISPSLGLNSITKVRSTMSAGGLEIGTTRIRLNNGQIFDYRERLEVENTAERRRARRELAVILSGLDAGNIDTIIRGLPNSSYRVGLGVAVALGDMKEKWPSSDPERSRKVLEQLPKLANKDATMVKAVNKALARIEPSQK